MKKGFRMTAIILSALVMSSAILTGCGDTKTNENAAEVTQNQNEEASTETEEADTEAEFTGVENSTVAELSTFDPLAGVTAKGAGGADATADLEVSGTVNTHKAGEYELTYSLKGSDASATRVVTVTEIEATLPNGLYNYKFAAAKTRNTLMAAAEDYLLHNQYGGIPLYSSASFFLFSNRMQLLSDDFIPVMGFGTDLSAMVADDSKVVMLDGENGNEGEYTYRTAIGQNPSQWNSWLSDDSTTSDLVALMQGTLYSYNFNADKTGYVLEPQMAEGMPIPVESRTLASGKVVSNKWQFKIREGLEWNFSANADTSMITDRTINAVDYYETYKHALTEQWFRATAGGGDFVASDNKLVGAKDYIDGVADWEAVGIKLIDDNTIQFEFVDEQSEWNVKYFLGGSQMTPVNMEQVLALGDQFGLDNDSIAYTGQFVVDYYESDKVIRLTKNPVHIDADKVFYTHRNISVIKEAEMRFQEFKAGKLDSVILPSTQYEAYKSHPGIRASKGSTTYRLVINGLGTPEGQVAQFQDSTWTPEPILANRDFKQAMYHAIDRKKLAEEVLKTSQPNMYHFTGLYLVEAEEGIPYRQTEAGKSVGTDLSPSTHGYNLDASVALFNKAINELVADGTYAAGDEITFEFYYFSGSEAQELMATFLKDSIEVAFVNEEHNISVKLDIIPKEFPGIYYDHMLTGEFDTSIGGISGSMLNAASFLEQYCDDNRGTFTLNWGIDTSVAEIPVVYENADGQLVKELWSYNALTAVLNGDVEIVDGEELPSEEE